MKEILDSLVYDDFNRATYSNVFPLNFVHISNKKPVRLIRLIKEDVFKAAYPLHDVSDCRLCI